MLLGVIPKAPLLEVVVVAMGRATLGMVDVISVSQRWIRSFYLPDAATEAQSVLLRLITENQVVRQVLKSIFGG